MPWRQINTFSPVFSISASRADSFVFASCTFTIFNFNLHSDYLNLVYLIINVNLFPVPSQPAVGAVLFYEREVTGIYGVMSHLVSQRQHEIGVRVALGANPGRVLGLVLRQGLRLAVIGVGIGLVGVMATTKLTESMVYGVSPADPTTVAGGMLFLVAVALLGSLVPARRATRVDPILALREE